VTVDQLGVLTALDAALSPLDGARLRTDAVITRISDAIGLGVMADGEQLPSEIDLANQLGVSTMTLREALAVLRQRGLVETRRGRGGGSFVRVSTEAINTRSLARLQEYSVGELRDLGDEHFAIAGAAARLAARRAVATDVAQLRALVSQLANSHNSVQSRRADSRLKIEVAVCSQSGRLARAEVNLQAELSPMLWLPQLAIDPAAEAAKRSALVDAIEIEDEIQARSLAEDDSVASVRRLIALRMELAQS
jgi:GntR family transcriptional regulator, L-lactate dehydrogenase operon regulator